MYKQYSNNWQVGRDRYLNEEEIKLLFNKCRELSAKNNLGQKIWLLVHLSFCTGLRVQEISSLKIFDLKLDNSEPRLFVKNGKGKRSRSVPIGNELRLHLKEYIAEFLPSVFQSNGKDDYLFQSSRQNQYSVSGHSVSSLVTPLGRGSARWSQRERQVGSPWQRPAVPSRRFQGPP